MNTRIKPQVDQLFQSPPLVHNDGSRCWKISRHLAECIVETVSEKDTTIETGCGLSTALFAQAGCKHRCIVPEQEEVEALQSYAASQEISLENVDFVVEQSQRYLPGCAPSEIDFALIDGCHAFPSPFIDWYYLEPSLRVGGVLVVDDTQIWTGAVLRSFLLEDEAWELLLERKGDFAAFIKRAEGSGQRGWNEQQFVKRRSKNPLLAKLFPGV